jgi:hypothetical protein
MHDRKNMLPADLGIVSCVLQLAELLPRVKGRPLSRTVPEPDHVGGIVRTVLKKSSTKAAPAGAELLDRKGQRIARC